MKENFSKKKKTNVVRKKMANYILWWTTFKKDTSEKRSVEEKNVKLHFGGGQDVNYLLLATAHPVKH